MISALFWREGFTEELSNFQQLYNYTVDISQSKSIDGMGIISLKGDPKFEGGSSTWYSPDLYEKNVGYGENDSIELSVKVNHNTLRVGYYYRPQGSQSYRKGQTLVSADNNWQTIKIYLKDAKPFYSGNYPTSLTPGKKPPLFVFFDNLLPGKYDVEISSISIVKGKGEGENE